MKKNENKDNLLSNFNHYNAPPRGNFLVLLGGIVVFLAGIYMIFKNTMLTTGFSLTRIIGFTPNFGLVSLPLLIGIIVLFFNRRPILGWVLIIAGILIILVGIFMGLRIYFMPVTLIKGIFMFGLTAAGIGLILKGLFGSNN